MRCLVTGTAGFIGYHVARRLLERGQHVAGVDGLTAYYDVKLKQARHAQLGCFDQFRPYCCMLEDEVELQALFRQVQPELVIHLAAQPGVRYSLKNRRPYVETNIVGAFNILEACREFRPRHILMASTSSVYGAAAKFPLSETDRTDHPLTLYAATKKSMEVIAHCYSHLWKLPISIFRFFTVYGPWGRPDMAPFKFVRSILEGRPIDVYNHGQMERDFTYIDDLVEAILRLSEKIPTEADGGPIVETDGTSVVAPYRIVNIGGQQPVKLMDFIMEIERAVGRKAECNFMPLQLGEAVRTEASTEFLEALIGYRPATPISVGVAEFVRWYRQYYQA